jgi:hypothetical protein
MTIKPETTDLTPAAKKPPVASARKIAASKKISPAPKKLLRTDKATQESTRAKKRVVTASAVRPGSKAAKILELIRRASGATLAEIMKATGWQPHSIRGFLSTATKKRHVKIDSSKNGVGQRVYRTLK